MSFINTIREDIKTVQAQDPAAQNGLVIFFSYPGLHAKWNHVPEHWLWEHGHRSLARVLSQITRHITGVEIHPAAQIGKHFFIDHAMGVVIGETAEVETGVVIYQGVTLGGSGKEEGKRHPTIKKGTVIGAGAKILGGFTVGEYSKIGAGAVVLKEVPPHATVVGVPGKVVRVADEKLPCDLKQDQCDPLMEEVCRLRDKVFKLEEELARMKQDEEKR